MDTGPQVNHVALGAAGLVEAVEDALLQVDAEGSATGVAAVDGTSAALLWAPAAQPRRQTELIEHPRQR